MYHSGEVRWFFEGELPDNVHRWFATGGPGQTTPGRVDEYLVLPGCTNTSVKFRDGRFEVKALTRDPRAATFDRGIEGFRDAWVKWSSEAGDIDYLRRLFVRADDRWVAVEKHRSLRLLDLTLDEPAEVTPGGAWLARGCQIELTSLRTWPLERGRAHSAPWWSLGFEAFNDPRSVFDDLGRAVDLFVREPPPADLRQECSMSYPVWLDRCVAGI